MCTHKTPTVIELVLDSTVKHAQHRILSGMSFIIKVFQRSNICDWNNNLAVSQSCPTSSVHT